MRLAMPPDYEIDDPYAFVITSYSLKCGEVAEWPKALAWKASNG